jgi:NADH-quinone oxidoreductase subunit J
MLEAVVFYILAAALLVFGLLVITRTNPIGSALSMVGAFAALAALYATLSASLAAIIQILVYAGGVMVLVIFVIMLLNLAPEDLKPLKVQAVRLVLALLLVLGVVLGPLFITVFPSGQWKMAEISPDFGSIRSVGEKVFSEYLFPFEMLSLLLLTAVVGALVLSKRKL